MSQRNEKRPRTCRHCLQTYELTAKEIKTHAQQCEAEKAKEVKSEDAA
jgi:hypothetical protein